MKQKLKLIKRGIIKYRKTIIDSFIRACLPAIAFTGQSAAYKYKRIQIGEYPEEPIEIINTRLQEMRLVIIREAVILFLLLTLIFFIIYLIYWLKRNHGINLLQELKTMFFQKNSPKE